MFSRRSAILPSSRRSGLLRSAVNTALSSWVIEDEQQRPRLFEKQLQLRQHARVAVVQPLRISRLAADVAAMIEHREGVAVLQRAGAPLLQRRS